MKYETAADPISGLKWTRKTTQKVAKELRSLGSAVSRNTVARLLRAMNFSLRVTAHLVTKQYQAGIKVSDSQMRALRIRPHATLPQ